MAANNDSLAMQTSSTGAFSKERLPDLTFAPRSILIVGAGVFGISTAHALLSNSRYDQTKITIVDAYAPSSTAGAQSEITASLDTSRIIRPDYSHPLYAALADRATCRFREGWAEDLHATERTYTQPGLVLISTGGEGSRGNEYLRKSLQNVRTLAQAVQQAGQVACDGMGNSGMEPVIMPTSRDIERLYGLTEGSLPEHTTGYVNPQAGWAHASAGIAATKSRVLALGRARQRDSKAPLTYLGATKVSSLLFSSSQEVAGAELSSGKIIEAEMTILATGAWTPLLLPSLFAPRLRSSGQVLAYIPLSNAKEVAKYAGKPTVLDMESGLFAIFPPKHYIDEARAEGHVKIARHGWGYAYPRMAKDPLTNDEVKCFLPPEEGEEFFRLPKEGRETCRDFARLIVPEIAEREFSLERVCWYTDTPSADFLVDLVPGVKGLMLATGGSGHGYKFLPVIGDKVVDRLEERLDSGLADLWRWRDDKECEKLWQGEGDASRGGRRGMLWEEELKE